MGGGITGDKTGVARLAAELKALRAQVADVLRAVRGLGIQVDATSQSLIVGGGRSIQLNDGGGLTINDGGSLAMKTPAGNLVVQAARIPIPDGSGRTQQVFALARDDGTPALYVADFGTIPGHPHQQNLALADRTGNVIFSEDTVSGHGLALPYLPAGVWADITSPGTTSGGTTTATLFTAMQWADSFQQHPRITASVLAQTPAGTTGQIRMTVGGVQVGATLTVPANTYGQLTILPAAWPSFTFGTRTVVQLEARVTSGAGAIGVRGLSLWGYGS